MRKNLRAIISTLFVLGLYFANLSVLANAAESQFPESPSFLPLPISHEMLDSVREQLGANWTLEKGFTGRGVSVAVLDDGAQIDHEQLNGRVIEEVCFNYENNRGYYECPNGKTFQIGKGSANYIIQANGRFLPGTRHGTNAISTILEFAPDVKIIVIKNGDPDSAYKWILDNARKYNIAAFSMSYGSKEWIRQRPLSQYSGLCADSNSDEDIFRKLWKIGVIPVASSANSGQFEQIDFPACNPWVASVGATEVGTNKISNFSNISNRLTLLAPAGFETANVTDDPNVKNAYFTFGGTSQSAPLAAALFAIGKSIKPDASSDELRGLARISATSIDDKVVRDNKLINFKNFVMRLLEPQSGFRDLKSTIVSKDQIKITWEGLSDVDHFKLIVDRNRTYDIPGSQTEISLSKLIPNYSGMAELIAFDKSGSKLWQEEEFLQTRPYKGIENVQVLKSENKLFVRWNDLKNAATIKLFVNGVDIQKSFVPSSELIEIYAADNLRKVRTIKIQSLDSNGNVIESEQRALPWVESKEVSINSGNSVKVNFLSSGKFNFEVKVKP